MQPQDFNKNYLLDFSDVARADMHSPKKQTTLRSQVFSLKKFAAKLRQKSIMFKCSLSNDKKHNLIMYSHFNHDYLIGGKL